MLDIGEVSKASGFTTATLRYYENLGLIHSAGRRGLRRQFQPEVMQRLSLITLGREAGFSLSEIASMFGDRGDLRIDRDALEGKAKELDATVKRLSAMRDVLRHAAECPAPSHLECDTFQRLLKVAQKRRSKRASG